MRVIAAEAARGENDAHADSAVATVRSSPMTARTSTRVALAALTIAAAWLVGGEVPSGFPLDDAWIHQVVARQAAGGPGFFVATSGGSSSLLWTWLLVPAHLLGVSEPVVYTRGLTIALWVGAVQALFGLSRADGWSDLESMAIAAGAAVSGQAVWFTWSGMEATLVITSSVSAVLAWRTGRSLARDAALAALAFTRPEGVALAVVLAAFERGWRARARLVVVPAAVAVAVTLWLWHTAGTPWPSTFAGRRWLYGLDEGVRPLDLAYFVAQWLHLLWYYTAERSAALAAIIATGCAFGAMAVWRRRALGWVALFAWTVTLLGIYFVLLPRAGHAGRYQPLIPALLLPLSTMGLVLCGESIGRTQAAAAALCATLALGVPSLLAWRQILESGIEHIEGTHRSLGRWARLNLPANARIAAFDIGALAWELPGQVVDLSALSSGNLTYLRERRVADLLRDEQADYVMLPSPPPGTMEGTTRFNLGPDQITLVEIQRRRTPVDRWQLSFDATSHAWAGQVLYAVDRGSVRVSGGH